MPRISTRSFGSKACNGQRFAPQWKSDLRNHQAIVQPRFRLYDCLMVTQITRKTEGPHGLPLGRRKEVDPLYPGLIILAVYDCGHAFQSLERSEPVRERIDRLDGAAAADNLAGASGTRGYGGPLAHSRGNFSVTVSLAGIEPVGFRVKSDLRNHQAIVHPRLYYDCLMVTQITLMASSVSHAMISTGLSPGARLY